MFFRFNDKDSLIVDGKNDLDHSQFKNIITYMFPSWDWIVGVQHVDAFPTFRLVFNLNRSKISIPIVRN